MSLNLENMRDGIQRVGLLNLIADLPSNLIMAEVGCFKGESTEMFLKSGKVVMLYAIDTWVSKRFALAEHTFRRRFTGRNGKGITILKMTTQQAISHLPALDCVYIDGDHTYEWVKTDILNSLKVVKKGGIIAGHDYVRRGNVGVIPAVEETIGKPDKIYEDSSWLKVII